MDLAPGQGPETHRIDNQKHQQHRHQQHQQNHRHQQGEQRSSSFHMKVCMNEGPAAALMDRCLDYAAINSAATR